MNSRVEEVFLDDGNIQKYQLVTGFEWDKLDFKSPKFDKKVIKSMARLYDVNIIVKNPNLYGYLVFFNCSLENIDLNRNTSIGYIFNDQLLLNYYFNKANDEKKVKTLNNQLIFEDNNLQVIYDNLLENNLIAISKGALDTIAFMPVSSNMGYLSDIKANNLSVNSHFFLMDKTDIDSPYDELGTPHSLALKNSKILLPPLNHRECLLIDYKNNAKIENLEVDDLKVLIDKIIYENEVNCKFFYRPENRITPKTLGCDLIIVKDKVVAIKKGGESYIPMAGFIIQVENQIEVKNNKIEYAGEKINYKFGIQVGPAMTINNKQTTKLDCPFYKGDGIPYPSTVYPLDFDKARAARIGLGTYKNEPILIWAEGAGKLGYIKKEESCGASLLEFSSFCNDYGIENLVNLDGGGSAQLIYKGKRALKIADREIDKITEAERPIPLGLVIN